MLLYYLDATSIHIMSCDKTAYLLFSDSFHPDSVWQVNVTLSIAFIDLMSSKIFYNMGPNWKELYWNHHGLFKWHMMTSSNRYIFFALLAICAGNSGEFPTQRPVTRSFDVYFDLRPNKRLSKQSWGWWFETPSRPLWLNKKDFLYRAYGNWTLKLHKSKYIRRVKLNQSKLK